MIRLPFSRRKLALVDQVSQFEESTPELHPEFDLQEAIHKANAELGKMPAQKSYGLSLIEENRGNDFSDQPREFLLVSKLNRNAALAKFAFGAKSITYRFALPSTFLDDPHALHPRLQTHKFGYGRTIMFNPPLSKTPWPEKIRVIFEKSVTKGINKRILSVERTGLQPEVAANGNAAFESQRSKNAQITLG